MTLVNLFGHTTRVVRRPRLDARCVTTLYGAVELDLTEAPLEPGDHDLCIVNICGHVTLRVPAHIGIALDAAAVLSELHIAATGGSEHKRLEHDWLSENSDRAAVRICVAFRGVLAGLMIVRVPVRDVRTDAQLPNSAAAAVYHMPGYEGATRKLGRKH